MPGKRSRADSREETICFVFEKLFAIANSPEPDSVALNLKTLKKLKCRLLSEEKGSKRKAAKDFTLDEAVLDFGLTYTPERMNVWWKIDIFPDFKTFQPSAGFVLFLKNYIAIYDRSSEAACRLVVDLLLCECIAEMRGPIQSTEDGRRTPTAWDTVKVHCEVSFTHTTNPMPMNPKTIVGGRVDHGVGIVIRSKKTSNRLFHSLLLCIEARFHGTLRNAVAQVVVYLACLRQSRINRGRSNTSVYGVATDGLSYVFVTITHEGVLKESRPFHILCGDLPTVLGCLRYILETAMSMSPNLTPEKEESKKSDALEASGDDPIDLDDYPSLHDDDSDDEH